MKKKNRARRAKQPKSKSRSRRNGRSRPARPPTPPEPRSSRGRAREEPPEREPGYAGMPRERWEDWGQVAETFVAERRCANPERVIGVLTLVLRHAKSWTELLAAHGWLLVAATEVYVHYVPGYGPPRTFQLLDRFVRWLHERGDIDLWRRRALEHAIDEQRRAHGHPGLGRPAVPDLVLGIMGDRVVAEFAETLDDPWLRDRAPSTVGLLSRFVEIQHGPGNDVPMGALDPELLISQMLAAAETMPDPYARDSFAIAARFYRWAGETARLEGSRADALASRFAAAALAIAA